MFNGKMEVAIIDIDSRVDIETGDRYKYVSRGTKLISKVDLVGIQTLQLGQSQGVNLSYSVEIPRYYFNGEKYCYFNDQLYSIFSKGKARIPTNMLLNVVELEDSEIEEAVREWLKGGKND